MAPLWSPPVPDGEVGGCARRSDLVELVRVGPAGAIPMPGPGRNFVQRRRQSTKRGYRAGQGLLAEHCAPASARFCETREYGPRVGGMMRRFRCAEASLAKPVMADVLLAA